MHHEILTKEQVRLLPLVGRFAKDFYLVGGTAIALHLGHRRSIDFDLFTSKPFRNSRIKRMLKGAGRIDKVFRDETGQYTIIINGVHMTFFEFPFAIPSSHWFEKVIKLPDVLTLAAMKAYALGNRAKWKDYVDLYFVMEKYHGIAAIADRAMELFKGEFNEKIFREQLSYFDDMNYSEEVIYLPGFEVEEAKIKKALTEFSLQ